jgi:cytochrome c oxidase assembly protein subunit 15
VTGGAVRLTGSGLGCPTWPRCTDSSFTPHGSLGVHGAIEFGNRMLTGALVVIAVATFVAAWVSLRRDVRVLAFLIALGIPAQIIIGGFTVLSDLNPWVVSFHLLCSLAIIGLSVVFLHRLSGFGPGPSPGPLRTLAWLAFAAAWVVLYLGTVVTGSGPHAGDADAARNGLDPLQVSQLHADFVFLFLGLCVGLYLAVRLAGRSTLPLRVLLVVIVLQGAVGFVQYFTDLPVVLVAFHMLGAALVSASVTWVLVSVLEPVRVSGSLGVADSRGSGEPGTASEPGTVPHSPPLGADAGQRCAWHRLEAPDGATLTAAGGRRRGPAGHQQRILALG